MPHRPIRPRRAGGGRPHSAPADRTISYTVVGSAIGLVLVARTEAGLAAVMIASDADALAQELQARFPTCSLEQRDDELRTLAGQVVGLIEAPHASLDLSLDLYGTPFQERVWQALRTIPAGETSTYTEIAARIGRPASVRAVAQACAANAIAIVIPCHRVVRRDGSLSGYRWGVERKRALLDREAGHGIAPG